MLLSKKAWSRSAPVLDAIYSHPFILELTDGSLEKERFGYYIEQDAHYLLEFARSFSLLAARCDSNDIGLFLRYAQFALKELVHSFFREALQLSKTNKRTTANLAYTHYLRSVCALEPVEVGFAAILPCFWIYREVGKRIIEKQAKDNFYTRWIEAYAGEEFSQTVDEAIGYFDHYGQQTSAEGQEKMLSSFFTAACFEWHFWDDAYHLQFFGNF